MERRDFLGKAALGLGGAWLGSKAFSVSIATASAQKVSAADLITLGRTGIRTTRLACGTGTNGYGHRSNQSVLGVPALADVLAHGYDQGIRFFETADAYGTHPHVGAALKRVPREKVTVLTKSWTRDPKGLRADLDRFRQELGTDYIDIMLLHCLTEDDWPTRYKGAMDVLSEAREKGIIRAHGVSCHSIGALRAAAKTPWVQVDLVRLNPVSAYMDADPDTVISVVWEMRAAGKGIIGMKILGQGKMRSRVDEALKHAVSSGVLDCFTIGAESIKEQEDLVRRIGALSV